MVVGTPTLLESNLFVRMDPRGRLLTRVASSWWVDGRGVVRCTGLALANVILVWPLTEQIWFGQWQVAHTRLVVSDNRACFGGKRGI